MCNTATEFKTFQIHEQPFLLPFSSSPDPSLPSSWPILSALPKTTQAQAAHPVKSGETHPAAWLEENSYYRCLSTCDGNNKMN